MRKALVATAVVVASAVGAVGAVAAWSGGAASARLEQQAQELSKALPNLKIVEQHTERGLFSSTHEVTVQLGCLPPFMLEALENAKPGSVAPDAAKPMRLTWRDVIHHGPFPGGKSFGAATVDSELLVPDAWKKQAEKLIGKQAPLRLHSEISFGGELVSTFTYPGVQFADPAQGAFSSKPITGRVMGKLPKNSLEGSDLVVDMPGVEISSRGPDGAHVLLKVGRMLAETHVGKRSDPKLWLAPTKSSGMVTSVDITGSAGSAGGTALPALRAHWDGIKFSSDATLDKGLWSTTSGFTAKGKINDFPIDKLEASASLRRLDVAIYQRVLSTLFGTMFSCEQPAQVSALESVLGTLQKDFAALLVNNPEYALDKLAIELSGKRAELSYSTGTSGVTASDLSMPVPLLLAAKGYARAKAQVHVGLIEQIANKVVNYDSAPGQQTPLAQTSGFVGGMLDQFAKLGYLERAGDQVRASAAMEGGQILLNGKPFALPDLGLTDTK